MIVYAAVDLRGGKAVQLVGGRTDTQKIALDDPVAVALEWTRLGFRALHVVDLDAALGSGDNREIIAEILAASDVPVQVGGGIRDDEAVETLIEAGAASVIVGTRAINDAPWLKRMSARHPNRITVAADVRGDAITTRGWTEQTQLDPEEFLDELNALSLAGVLMTDVGREGQLGGVDVAKFERYAKRTRHPLIAAGGIRDIEDLRGLQNAGVGGAVLGMSLYVGTIDPKAAIAEFA
ncbi:MAG TPA: 1-(5-phosphoribosyl)-5-[(5-phosphoribosylamino)methylideneamino] imidazole-4-carboxamide isomerase [Longimicrobiales bacterium]|nr:1-(5-phosphoribosyl)-5-[(5-phosphoribosylamino)methylideneamino] imidazole-4-carboxamide isomerase [Longimicrobiales bacterium]